MNAIKLQPIGVIQSPFNDLNGMPIQPKAAEGISGTVTVFPDYREGLQDLAGFSHIILLYHFHRSTGFALSVVPFLDVTPRGVFATRAPRRPNPIGLSVVGLQRVNGGNLHVVNVDILNGTPLLDIKPYVPVFDAPAKIRTGWLEGAQGDVAAKRSDGRFTGSGDESGR